MDRHRLGELTRTHREASGLTTRAAAAGSGISHSTWNQVETGTMNATIETLAAIAQRLGRRWAVDLVPDTGRDARRQALLDRLSRIVDELGDRDVALLLAQVDLYADELGLGSQGQTRT